MELIFILVASFVVAFMFSIYYESWEIGDFVGMWFIFFIIVGVLMVGIGAFVEPDYDIETTVEQLYTIDGKEVTSGNQYKLLGNNKMLFKNEFDDRIFKPSEFDNIVYGEDFKIVTQKRVYNDDEFPYNIIPNDLQEHEEVTLYLIEEE